MSRSRKVMRIRTVAAAVVAVLMPVGVWGGGAVSPDVVELVLQPGDTGTARFRVTVPPLQATYEPLDVVFVFDGTASMGDEIDDFQRSIDAILSRIARRSNNVRYAVAAFGDHAYLHPCGSPNPPVWQLLSDFTTDPATARSAVSRIDTIWNGCDTPEAYLEALAEARQLRWRPAAEKYVVIVGDAPARSPDRGFDDIMGTADDLDFRKITDSYRDAGITIAGIYAPAGDEVARSFAMLAEPTHNGMAIPLDRGTTVADAIEQAIIRPAPPPPAPLMRGRTPGLSSWLGTPNSRKLDSTGLHYEFVHPVTVPAGTQSAIYEIDVQSFGGPDGKGGAIGVGRIILRVGWEYYPIRSILQWLAAALALIALLILLIRRSREFTSELEFGGAALKESAKSYAIASLIILAGIAAWRAAPEDYIDFVSSVTELSGPIFR